MKASEIEALCELAALNADLQEVIVGVEGMKALNTEREHNGYALGYDEAVFVDASREIKEISQKMRALKGGSDESK